MRMQLRNWLRAATPAQRVELARRADTTTGYLYQLAGDSAIDVSARLATLIEIAAREMRKRDELLPEVRREKLSSACAACDVLKRCRRE